MKFLKSLGFDPVAFVKNLISKKLPEFDENKPARVTSRKFNHIPVHSGILNVPCGFDYKGVADWGDRPINFIEPTVNGNTIQGTKTIIPPNSLLPNGSTFQEGTHIGEHSTVGSKSIVIGAEIGEKTNIEDLTTLTNVKSKGDLNIGYKCKFDGHNVFNGFVSAKSGLSIEGKSCIFNESVVAKNDFEINSRNAFFEQNLRVKDNAKINNTNINGSLTVGENGRLNDILVKGAFASKKGLEVSGDSIFAGDCEFVGARLHGNISLEGQYNYFIDSKIEEGIVIPQSSSLKSCKYNPFIADGKHKRGVIGPDSELHDSEVNFTDIEDGVYLSNATIKSSTVNSIYLDEYRPSTFNKVEFFSNQTTRLVGCMFQGKNIAHCDMEIIGSSIDKKKNTIDFDNIPWPVKGKTIEIENMIVTGTQMDKFEGIISFKNCDFADTSPSEILKHEGFLIESDKIIGLDENEEELKLREKEKILFDSSTFADIPQSDNIGYQIKDNDEPKIKKEFEATIQPNQSVEQSTEPMEQESKQELFDSGSFDNLPPEYINNGTNYNESFNQETIEMQEAPDISAYENEPQLDEKNDLDYLHELIDQTDVVKLPEFNAKSTELLPKRELISITKGNEVKFNNFINSNFGEMPETNLEMNIDIEANIQNTENSVSNHIDQYQIDQNYLNKNNFDSKPESTIDISISSEDKNNIDPSDFNKDTECSVGTTGVNDLSHKSIPVDETYDDLYKNKASFTNEVNVIDSSKVETGFNEIEQYMKENTQTLAEKNNIENDIVKAGLK